MSQISPMRQQASGYDPKNSRLCVNLLPFLSFYYKMEYKQATLPVICKSVYVSWNYEATKRCNAMRIWRSLTALGCPSTKPLHLLSSSRNNSFFTSWQSCNPKRSDRSVDSPWSQASQCTWPHPPGLVLPSDASYPSCNNQDRNNRP